jgi:hypothetical protein
MGVAINSQTGHGWLVIDITGSATTHNLGNILNPEGVPIKILETVMYIVTAGLADCDLHVGVGLVSVGVGQADIFDDFGIDGTAGTAWNSTHSVAANTEHTTPAIMHATDYFTFYTDTAYSTGFVGKMYSRYVRLTD